MVTLTLKAVDLLLPVVLLQVGHGQRDNQRDNTIRGAWRRDEDAEGDGACLQGSSC